MKDKIKVIPHRIKNHYEHNKFGYAMGALAVAAIALQQANGRAFYAFLESKGIDPEEFYNPESWVEKNS
jgi:hypothetical protein